MATQKTVERTYTIPLRKEYQKVPYWRRTKKAVKAAKEFLAKHMKSTDVKLGKALNEYLWSQGIRNPPHKVKVSVTKNDKGQVTAELFGAKVKETKSAKKTKGETAKKQAKAEAKTDKKETKAESEKPAQKA